MDEGSFSNWLKSNVVAFRGLSGPQRLQVISTLLNQGDASERLHWQNELTEYFHRDIVAWLPLELSLKILNYLDAKSLFSVCRVSRTWKTRAESSCSLWRAQANLVGGIQLQDDARVQDWKEVVRCACKKRQRLKEGRAFSLNRVFDQSLPANVVTMDYHLGYYVTASVNEVAGGQEEAGQVCLYVWPSKKPIHVYKHARSCVRASAIKLLFPECVCVGYVDGYITIWRIQTGQQVDLVGHAGAIYSLAADVESKVLVSGSADRTAIIWDLEKGIRLNRIVSQAHWIVAVELRPKSSNFPNVLLTMSKEFVHVFKWETAKELENLRSPVNEIALKSDEGYQELRDVFFTPGLSLRGREVTFIRQMPLFETQTIGDADIVTMDVFTGVLKRSIHVNQKVRKLLAVGKRFALALLPFVDQRYKNLAVVDIVEKRIIGGCCVPHSRASTPDFAQILMGDTEWLDGLSVCNSTRNLITALATQDNAVCFVSWHS